MIVSIEELAQAREVVTRLLDELCLDAYLFEVEPGEGRWSVTVECAVAEGWETVSLSADKALLLRDTDDAVAHAVLLDDWREALAGCRTKG